MAYNNYYYARALCSLSRYRISLALNGQGRWPFITLPPALASCHATSTAQAPEVGINVYLTLCVFPALARCFFAQCLGLFSFLAICLCPDTAVKADWTLKTAQRKLF